MQTKALAASRPEIGKQDYWPEPNLSNAFIHWPTSQNRKMNIANIVSSSIGFSNVNK